MPSRTLLTGDLLREDPREDSRTILLQRHTALVCLPCLRLLVCVGSAARTAGVAKRPVGNIKTAVCHISSSSMDAAVLPAAQRTRQTVDNHDDFDPLFGNVAEFRQTLRYVGPGEHLFINGVSKRWRSIYAQAMRGKRHWSGMKMLDLRATACAAVVSSVSRLQ